MALGNTLDAAERKLDELLERPRSGDTIESMCRSYIEEQQRLLKARDRNALAARTVSDYEISLERFVLPAFGKMQPCDFKPMFTAKYLDHANKSGSSVCGNRDMAALALALNHGMVLGLVEANPCRGVRRNREHARKRLVQIAEFDALLAFAKAKGGFTGVRKFILPQTFQQQYLADWNREWSFSTVPKNKPRGAIDAAKRWFLAALSGKVEVTEGALTPIRNKERDFFGPRSRS